MASPQSGYERPTGSLGRSGHRAGVLVLAFVVFLAAVMVKPWGGAETTSARVPRSDSAADRQSGGELQRDPSQPAPPPGPMQPAQAPPWPATPEGVLPATSTAAVEASLDDLGRRGGTWGVWIAGAGPRLTREEPWSDWIAVSPEPSSGAPSHVATWPGTEVCGDLPVLRGRPTVVAVTAPGPLPSGSRIDGWWTDGARVAQLAGSIGYLSIGPPGAPGRAGAIGGPLLVRVDGGTWPAGRYELHVASGTSTTALTFCLGELG